MQTVLDRPRATPGPGFLRLASDERLAALIADGDAHAFSVAFDRHLPALVRYCQGIVMNREDAEDAAQNAMLAALRSLPDRGAGVNLRAWLYRVAHNEAVSLLRRRRPHEALEDVTVAADSETADVAATRMRLSELISDLRSLPERQRGALVMRELCGLGYGEIAGALGGDEAAAMRTVFEARSALTQNESGRDVACSTVQRCMSDGDRRRLRNRRLRAHVRDCAPCREFERSITTRRRDFALLLPLTGKGLLAALLGGGGLRLAATTTRLPPMPAGARAAIACLALATATGGIAVHGHAGHPALGHARPAHGARSAPAQADSGTHSGLRRRATLTTTPAAGTRARRLRARRIAAAHRSAAGGRATEPPARGVGLRSLAQGAVRIPPVTVGLPDPASLTGRRVSVRVSRRGDLRHPASVSVTAAGTSVVVDAPSATTTSAAALPQL